MPAVATVMVLANWDHHHDLDKEVSVLTIPKNHFLLLAVSVVVASSTLGFVVVYKFYTQSTSQLVKAVKVVKLQLRNRNVVARVN